MCVVFNSCFLGVYIPMTHRTRTWRIMRKLQRTTVVEDCEDCGCTTFNTMCGNPTCSSHNIVRRDEMSPNEESSDE